MLVGHEKSETGTDARAEIRGEQVGDKLLLRTMLGLLRRNIKRWYKDI